MNGHNDMLIKNNEISRKQILIVVLGIITLGVGTHHFIEAAPSISVLINNETTEPNFYWYVVHTIAFGVVFTAIGIIALIKSKVIRVLVTKTK